MLLDAQRFTSFTPHLEEHWRVFRDEFAAVPSESLLPWPVRAAYSGNWLLYPLFVFDPPPGWSVDYEAHRRSCPATTQLLAQLPHLRTAGFSVLTPGTHILPHQDKEHPRVVRAHLGLVVPQGAAMRVAGSYRYWQDGKVSLFDGQLVHETANFAPTPRVVMLLDFELDHAEWALVLAARDGASGRPRSCRREDAATMA